MPVPSLDGLGEMLIAKRSKDGIGVREAAKRIGISAATISRVENGFLPDLLNFKLICEWLKVNPDSILGFGANQSDSPSTLTATVHFKKKTTISREMATALTNTIIAAQRVIEESSED